MYQLNNRVFLTGEASGTEWRARLKKLLEGSNIPVTDDLDQNDPEMRVPYQRNEHFIHDRVVVMYSGSEVGSDDGEKRFPGVESLSEMAWPEIVWSGLYTKPKEAGQQLYLVIEDARGGDQDYAERRRRFKKLHAKNGARIFDNLEAAVAAIKEEMIKAS